MKVKKHFLTTLLFVFLLGFIVLASASFSVGDQNYSIQNHYIQDSYLSGWINISFNEMPVDSLFWDSLLNNVTIRQALDLNENYDYNCSVLDCENTYTASAKELTKTFQLRENKSKTIGFKLKDKIEGINSLSMKLQSNAGISCSNQVKLDFTNNGVIEVANNKSGSNYCPLKYAGCFEIDDVGGEENSSEKQPMGMTGQVINIPEEILITNTPLCQKIELPEAPEMGIGAWIKETEAGNRKVVMELFDLDTNFIGDCNLSKMTMSQSGKRIACSIDLELKQPKEYYICVHTQGTSGEYKTRGYVLENNSCGFIGYPPATPTSAYDVFAQPVYFNSVGIMEIGNDLEGNQNISQIIEDYILEKYGSLDCSDECLIPLQIYSSKDQSIILSNLKLTYNKIGLGIVEEKYFYDFQEISAKVDADYQKLFLDNLFLISAPQGSLIYQLSLGETNIINQNITIEQLEMSVDPTTTAAEVPTTFKVSINPAKNIKEYIWDFGDGTTQTTTTSSIEHTYESIQNYTLTITAVQMNASEDLTKSFEIEVKSPESIIQSKIDELRENIENINSQLLSFDAYTKQKIENLLDLETQTSKLNELEQDFQNATTEQEFITIVKALFALNIPNSVILTGLEEILLTVDSNNIDLPTLTSITGESYEYEDHQGYIDAILKWNQEEFKTKATTKKILFKYGDRTENVLNIFEFRFERNQDYEPYFILEKLEDLNMSIEYSTKQNNVYMQLGYAIDNFKLDTTEDIEIKDLVFFVSPPLSELSIISTEPGIKNKNYLWGILGVVVVLIGALLYTFRKKIFNKKWGQKKFIDGSELNKLQTYINAERKRGGPDSTIRNNLKKAGWQISQINHALRPTKNKKKLMLSFSFFKKKRQ